MHYFPIFAGFWGLRPPEAPRTPPGLCPKHCRLVYIAIFVWKSQGKVRENEFCKVVGTLIEISH